MRHSKKRTQAVLIGIAIVATAGITTTLLSKIAPNTPAPSLEVTASQDEAPVAPIAEEVPYTGTVTPVGDRFSVRVPNGWNASISPSSTFLAIMFGTPGTIANLNYDELESPTIGNGIAPWSGLTEHFFILAPTDVAEFNPAEHLQVTSEDFTFDDGVIGTKYTVIKYAEEAERWGGLLKDTEWQGRVYVYETAARRIEAHLAVYPSTAIDLAFFEEVARSITTN